MHSKRIGTNAIYNLIGVVAPMAVSIFATPAYLHVIGEARYGILSLVWIVFGYFGLFDFGLSRATTNRLAQLREGAPTERNAVFYTALAANLLLGVVAGILFFVTMSNLLANGIAGHSTFVEEIPPALPWFAFFFPLALIGGVFVGALEAEERFLTLNLQQVVGTLLQQTLPLAFVLMFVPKIEYAILGALTARTVSVIWNAMAAFTSMRNTGRPVPRLNLVWSLLRYGANVTVTNVIGPLLVSADQFLIASLLGAKAVAYYVVPFNLAMKGTILPGAVSRAIFPRFSGLDGDAASALAERASLTLSGVSAIFCVPAIILSNFGLTIWLGHNFAAAATPVAQWLFLGTWINGLAFIPFALLQGRGRPDITAKFHALELLPFLGVLWLFIHLWGLPGAAIAWCLRVAVDAGLIYWASGARTQHMIALLPAASCVICAWIIAAYLHPAPVFAFVWALLLAVAMFVWLLISNPDLRRLLAPVERRVRFAGRS